MPCTDLVPTNQDYWLTRDRYEGALAPEVDVWTYPPVQEAYPDGDVLWLPPLDVVDERPTFYTTVSLETARRLWGDAVPEGEKGCVHVSV